MIAAIGNFDGVHRGHAMLLRRTIEFARAAGEKSGAVVFDPHPRRFFRPDDPPFLITTSKMRDALIRAAGCDAVLPVIFDKALAASTPEEFVLRTLKSDLNLKGVVTGADFRFGKDRAGDAEGLAALCKTHGLEAHIVDPLSEKGHSDKIGSTAIREALLSGAVDLAAQLLGRRWRVDGVVERGKQLGRTIGFPTANLTLGDLIEPRRGVYAVRADVGGKSVDGVANFGRRPTVDVMSPPLLEVFLFDFSGDLYGKEIGVDFVHFIRDEMRFDGLDALKRQIALDCETAQKFLSAV